MLVEHQFWKGVVWYGVNRIIIHSSNNSSHYSINPFMGIKWGIGGNGGRGGGGGGGGGIGGNVIYSPSKIYISSEIFALPTFFKFMYCITSTT